MPYVKNGDAPKIPALIQDMNNDKKLAFTVFDGDTKDGSSICSNQVIGQEAKDRFNQLAAPTIYVLGDNEWTDCHRKNNGGYNNLERLNYLRQTMFDTTTSFGQRKLTLDHQGPLGGLYSENTRWVYGNVVFVGLNVPGSNNNKIDDLAACANDPKSARDLAQCQADEAEYEARDAANIQWVKDAFALAKQQGLAGVVITEQGDPSFDLPETENVNERMLPGFDGYDHLIATLESETKAFSGQVLFVHGDTHYFKVDKPLVDQADLIPNFTRVETFGSPNVDWVKVTVDPGNRNLFTIDPMIVPGNQ